MSFHSKSGSHIPLLLQILPILSGPILELGIGHFSTPLFHWYCIDHNIQLVSYDNDPKYFSMFSSFESSNHKLVLVNNWDDVYLDTIWGLVFIDHAPRERRKVEAIKVSKLARFVIIHDSDGKNEHQYHYSEVYPHYKYVKTYKKFRPHTTVLSNYEDLKGLKDVD